MTFETVSDGSMPVTRPVPREIVLSGASSVIGELLPIASFAQLREAEEGLRFNGLEMISSFTGDPFDKLRHCIAQALERAGANAAEIDAIVFTTGNSAWSETLDRRLLVMLTDLGLGQARVVVAGGLSCGNTSLALATARSLLRAGEAGRVLFASLDFVPDGQQRLTPPDIAVDSDGASAAVLGHGPCGAAGGFRLRAQSSSYAGGLAGLADIEDDMQAFIMGHLTGVAENFQAVLREAGLDKDDVHHVIAPNLNKTLINLISEAISVDPARIYTDNIARTSHAQSSDNLINLVSMEQAGRIAANDNVLMVASSNFGWSMSLLQRL